MQWCDDVWIGYIESIFLLNNDTSRKHLNISQHLSHISYVVSSVLSASTAINVRSNLEYRSLPLV